MSKDKDDLPWEGEDEFEDKPVQKESAKDILAQANNGERRIEEASLEALMKMVDEGRKGEAPWIPISFPGAGKHVFIGQQLYYLLGGASGTGKTALAHQMFILHPYVWYKNHKDETNIKLKIILRNMERPTHMVFGKWCCMYIYQKYGVLLDVTTILGRGLQKSKVTDEIYEYIKEAKDYFQEMLDVLTVIPGAENPTGINKRLVKLAEEEYGKVTQIDKYQKKYDLHNDKQITLVLIDHIGRISQEQGFSERENLAKMSEYLSKLRDHYYMSPVVINQFNRGHQETARRKFLEPEPRDFKGASNMYEDADYAMALFNPGKFGLTEFDGYMIDPLTSREGINRHRALKVLKNSWGMDDFITSLRFTGEIGQFTELPDSSKMTPKLYHQYANLLS